MKNLLDEELPKLPRLNNLKTLSLNGWCMNCHSGPMAWFLEHAPNLEKLRLWMNKHHCLEYNKKRKGRVVNDHSDLSWIVPSQCSMLKKVEIQLSPEFQIVHGSTLSFLRNMKALENVEIVICN
jgi:hypothetical protein